MPNKGKVRLHLPLQGRYIYVHPVIKKLVHNLFIIVGIGIFLLIANVIYLALQSDQVMHNPYVEAHTVTPTPTQLCYWPKETTRDLIESNPQFYRKLKEVFGDCQALYVSELLDNESGWNPGAINPSSGACGLFQFYPCSKLKCELTDIDCQLKAGYSYIKRRYGNAQNALEFWKARQSEGNAWY